jgi:hypothetical protein
MFFAWSPMRSIALATHSVSSADEIVRGSSIMKVIRLRRMVRNSWSMISSPAMICHRLLAVEAREGVERVVQQVGGALPMARIMS